ncbi:MAG: hypothetical protein JWQ00_112 [Noviherbaspirillum sp.]|nr:hypothetical protein [Noviherbaspirillum sp.]
MTMPTPTRLRAVMGQRYDTGLLANGAVSVPGFDIEYVDAGKVPGALFREGLRGEFDICEQAFSHYLIARDQGLELTAVPVFPSHLFPHYTIFVHRDSDIFEPTELTGRRVALPDFGYNPAVWARGMLQEQYRVPIERIEWVESARRPLLGDLQPNRAARFQVIPHPAGHGNFAQGLYGFADAIAQREIDAIILPRKPADADHSLRPLLTSPYAEALRYAESTGAVPINTVLTLTNDAVRRHPDLPGVLLSACGNALERFAGGLTDPEHSGWHQDLDMRQLQTDRLFPWRYGVSANRRVIETMLRYCREQGVIRRHIPVEDLFAA